MLTALAFEGRSENKDAYDLIHLLQNYGDGIDDVFQRTTTIIEEPVYRAAVQMLERDFAGLDSIGTKRLAEFLGDSQDEAIRADVAGVI